MYQDINILSIETSFVDKKINVYTNFDIDPTTVNNDNIIVFDKESSTELILDFKIKNKIIEIYIKEEIEVNKIYTFKIQNICNIIGEKISSGILKEIKFESSIKDIPIIYSPAEYEEISKLIVKLKTENEIKYDFKYFIQVSKDMAFINNVIQTDTIENSITLPNLENGQYFVRARIESKDIGRWSETTSFIIFNIEEDTDSDEPIYEEEIVVTEKPKDGETPEKICIYFSGDIYASDVTNISITRRKI